MSTNLTEGFWIKDKLGKFAGSRRGVGHFKGPEAKAMVAAVSSGEGTKKALSRKEFGADLESTAKKDIESGDKWQKRSLATLGISAAAGLGGSVAVDSRNPTIQKVGVAGMLGGLGGMVASVPMAVVGQTRWIRGTQNEILGKHLQGKKLTEEERVRLTVIDPYGQAVKQLPEQHQAAAWKAYMSQAELNKWADEQRKRGRLAERAKGSPSNSSRKFVR